MTAPGLEGLTVSAWITATLAGDTELQTLAGSPESLAARIYEGAAPPNAPGDWWITFTILDPVDVKVVGLTQVMARVQFQLMVRSRSATYLTPAGPVYKRCHELLEGQVNRPQAIAALEAQGLILTCERVSGRQYPETADGVEYRHLGGLYETNTQ